MISIATAGVGTAFIISAIGGGVSGALSSAWEDRNNKKPVDRAKAFMSGMVGAVMNVTFTAYGKGPGISTGKTVSEVGKAVWNNGVKEVTNKAGRFLAGKALRNLSKGVVESFTASSASWAFGNVFKNWMGRT